MTRKEPHLESVCLPGIDVMFWSSVAAKAGATVKTRFLTVSAIFDVKETHSQVSQRTVGAAGYLEIRCITERPAVPLYLNELSN